MKNEGNFGENLVKQNYEASNDLVVLEQDFVLFLEQLNNDELLDKEKKEIKSKLSKIYKKTLYLIKTFEFATAEEGKLEKPDQHIVEMHNKNILSLNFIKEKFEKYKEQENNYDQNSES